MTIFGNSDSKKENIPQQESGDSMCAANETAAPVLGDDAMPAEAIDIMGNPAEDKSEQKQDETQPQNKEDGPDPLEELREQLEAQKDKYIRLMAEFDNYKRRTGKEFERIIESANERLMLDIIEVRESFERALKAGPETVDIKAFTDGMRLIFAKLDSALVKNGLSMFAEIGDEFDPQVHDAMMKTASDEIDEDHIAGIYEKGYALKSKVIKHARVIVSSGPAQIQAEEKNDDNGSAI